MDTENAFRDVCAFYFSRFANAPYGQQLIKRGNNIVAFVSFDNEQATVICGAVSGL